MPIPAPRALRAPAVAVVAALALTGTLTACGSTASHDPGPGRTAPATRLAAAERPDAAGVVHVSSLAPASGSVVRATAGSDHAAPALTAVSWTPVFYPVRDGYRDTFTVSATTDERTWAMLVVRNRAGQLVRRVRTEHAAGRMTLSWNGILGSGRMAPAASYRWSVTWHDAAGNRATSASRTLTVSHRRLVTRTARWVLPAHDYWNAGGSDPSCSQADVQKSFYRGGLWLANDCSGAIAAAFYRIHVPAAISYGTVSVQAWGFTDRPGTRVYRAFGRSGGNAAFASGRFTTLDSATHGLHSFGSAPASGVIGASRYLLLALSVDDRPSIGRRDFDARDVRVQLSYRVLS